MKKTFLGLLLISALILCGLFFVSCGDDYSKAEMCVGKYYAENNADSYVEILSGQYIRFVNIDFTYIQDGIEEVHSGYFENISITERFGNDTHKYIPMTDANKNIHFYVDIPDSAFAIRIYYIDESIIELNLGGVKYFLQSEKEV